MGLEGGSNTSRGHRRREEEGASEGGEDGVASSPWQRADGQKISLLGRMPQEGYSSNLAFTR